MKYFSPSENWERFYFPGGGSKVSVMVGDAAIARTWTFDIFALQTVNPGVHWRIQGRGQANPLIFRPN